MGGSEKSRFVLSFDVRRRLLGAGLLRLLGQQDGLDVGQHASLSDRDARQQLVQLLVVADGQLEVTRDDASLLVVASGVTGQLENLGGQVLHDGGQVDGRSGTDSLGVVAFAQQTVDATDRELESGTTGSALRLSLDFATLSASRHCVVIRWNRIERDEMQSATIEIARSAERRAFIPDRSGVTESRDVH